MTVVEQLLQQINANVQEVREMLNDNLYITCFDDGEISIVYLDLPGSTYDKQVDMAYPKIIEFIKSNGTFVEDLIRNKHPELETLDNLDIDTLCDIVYDITESDKFEKFMIEYFEGDPQIAEYAQEEFDYDIYIHEYIHTTHGYDDNGEPYIRLNSRYIDEYSDDY